MPENHPTKKGLWTRRGSEIRIDLSAAERERFWLFVEETETGCWEWIGLRARGYGVYEMRGRAVRAHRVSWTICRGPIAEYLTLDHLCRNRACVNPMHLEAVSNKVNILRGESFSAENARKTHCPRGHEYTPENTMIRNGKRNCRECVRAQHREAQKRYKQRKGQS